MGGHKICDIETATHDGVSAEVHVVCAVCECGQKRSDTSKKTVKAHCRRYTSPVEREATVVAYNDDRYVAWFIAYRYQ